MNTNPKTTKIAYESEPGFTEVKRVNTATYWELGLDKAFWLRCSLDSMVQPAICRVRKILRETYGVDQNGGIVSFDSQYVDFRDSDGILRRAAVESLTLETVSGDKPWNEIVNPETGALYEIESENEMPYSVSPQPSTEDKENQIIEQALKILRQRFNAVEDIFTSPDTVRDYLKLHLADKPYEVFGVVWLNNRHGVIGQSDIFRGTIDGASVHPREVVREAIAHNAAAVVFYHNHPSGNPTPSQADRQITSKLKESLSLIDVRVLDHIVCGGAESYSFAEHGLI